MALFRVLAVMTAALLLMGSAPEQRENVYQVEARIFVGGVRIGSPQIKLMSGTEGIMTFSDRRGYAFRVTVDDKATSVPQPGMVAVNSEVYFPNGTSWSRVGRPQFRLAPGSTARFQSNEATTLGPGGYTVELTVRSTGETASASDVVDIAECPAWRAVAKAPLEGVRLIGAKKATQDMPDIPIDPNNCCGGSGWSCCGSPGGKVCCIDPDRDLSCCTQG